MMEQPPTSQTPETPRVDGSRIKLWLRISLAALLGGGVWFVLQNVDVELSDPEAMQAMMQQAGLLGVGGFVLAFALGQVAQMPGLPFVLAARFAYGPFCGFAASYVAALLAVATTFVLVRAATGSALSEIKWRWVEKMLAKLEERPVRTVLVLRAVFAVSPPLNAALAASPVRFRQHFAGSAIGLLVPLTLWIALADVLMGWID